MSSEPKNHLWIPDEEVQRIDKTLTARPKQRNIAFADHGSKLSQGLQDIKQVLESSNVDSSLKDLDMLVFNVELPDGEKIQDKKDLFDSNGIRVRAVRNVRSAIVTSTHNQFRALKRRVEAYTQNGTLKTYFDFIESFAPFIGSEKNSSELRKTIGQEKPPVTLDI